MTSTSQPYNYTPYIGAETVVLANYIYQKAANLGVTITEENVISWLNSFIQDTATPFVQLSATQPNFESIKQQFQAILQTKDSWRDVIQAGGGETILEFVATIGNLGQTGIISALEENSLDGAVLTSSIYTNMRNLGVHITRRIPSAVQVTFQNPKQLYVYIPRLSQFVVDGVGFFNRDPIVMNSSQAQLVAVTLYVGTVNMESYTSTGLPYQRFEIGTGEYDISDPDIYCFSVTGTEWTRVTTGLWDQAPTANVFQENSTAEGNVEMLFGNSIYASIPPVNTVLQMVYIKTSGNGNDTTITGRAVNLAALNTWTPDAIQSGPDGQSIDDYSSLLISSIQGTTTSPVANGYIARDKEHYRAVGPFINSGRMGMIRKKDHYGRALDYPNIVDVCFQNQRDLAPYNRNFINVVWVTPLMSGGQAMTDEVYEDFLEYLNNWQIWRVEFVHVKPTRIPLTPKAVLYANQETDLQGLAPYAKTNLLQSLGIRRGSLGFSVTPDDITKALGLKYKYLSVDYVDLISPNYSTSCSPTSFIDIVDPDITALPTTRRQYITATPPDIQVVET